MFTFDELSRWEAGYEWIEEIRKQLVEYRVQMENDPYYMPDKSELDGIETRLTLLERDHWFHLSKERRIIRELYEERERRYRAQNPIDDDREVAKRPEEAFSDN